MEQAQTPHVYTALAQVKKAIARVGVEKSGYNKDQKYNYRGIDDVMDSFAGPLAEAELMVLPSYSNLNRRDLTTKSGGNYFYWSVDVALTFLSLKDGSHVVAGPFHGEAADTQDKGTTKVQSVAYRVGMLLAFTCPVGPEADPEAHSQPEEYDTSEFIGRISGAETKAELDKIGQELKDQAGTIPQQAMVSIRRAWAEKAKNVNPPKEKSE